MTKYNVTLNFTFEPHFWDDDLDYEKNKSAKEKAYKRTDAYYEKNSIEDHVKSNDALGFVEYVVCDGEVLSAKWDEKEFAIHMVVETEQTDEELLQDLRMNSLEDGEYEACGDTGWVVMTRGPNGERFGPPWDMKDVWEYGLTDYRSNEITITKAEDTTTE